MTESQEVQETIDEQQIENARVGYQVATSLWNSRAGEFWSQFNAMLTANSIVLAAATATTAVAVSAPESIPSLKSILSLLSIGVPIVGLALCALWCALHERASGYNEYWARSARELEEQFLNDPIKTLSWGALFGEGEPIQFDGDPKPLRMNRIGRIRVRHTVRLIIAVFVVMYLAILVWGLRG